MHDDHAPPPTAPPVCRVGVDLTAVGEVATSLATQGERYLRRLFTDHEVASSEGPDGPAAEPLAARFAAKEAAIKVLRPTGGRPEWRDIEVRRGTNGACDLVLHGSAAALASDQGIEHLSLSMSHEGGMAVAVVVGWGWAAPAGDGLP